MKYCNLDEQNDFLLKAFNDYTMNYENEPEVLNLKKRYLESARQIVEQYLGYRLDIHEVDEEHIYIHSRDIYLREFPVEEVFGVSINGSPIPAPYYQKRGDHVRIEKQICIPCNAEIDVQYCAGFRKLPDIVTQTILRVASLLQTEANGNIGISSKSYSDGSRSFNQFTSFEKYLQPLYPLRSTKLT